MLLEFGPVLSCEMGEECPLVISSSTDEDSPSKLSLGPRGLGTRLSQTREEILYEGKCVVP